MPTTIFVAGATGHLGGLIVRALLARGAHVTALVRPGADAAKRAALAVPGVTVVAAELANHDEVTRACAGAACVVSAMQGLRDVIVDGQRQLLAAAIAAGVPRFIPSDYSIDFTKTPDGGNRNLDLRRAFHVHLDAAPIAATSILNGAFAGLLGSRMILELGKARATYWGDPDQRMDFTTTENTAEYTAAAALDASTPRILRIAGDQRSARELAAIASEVKHTPFELVRLGSVDELAAAITAARAADPSGEQQTFPRWQGMQYMHDMFSGHAKLEPIDNDRYTGITWTTARDVIAAAS